MGRVLRSSISCLIACIGLLGFELASALANDEEKAHAKEVVQEYLKAVPRLVDHYGRGRGTVDLKEYHRQPPADMTKEQRKALFAKVGGFDAFPEEVSTDAQIDFVVDGPRRKADVRYAMHKKPASLKPVSEWVDTKASHIRMVYCADGDKSFIVQWKNDSTAPTVSAFGADALDDHWLKQYLGPVSEAPFSTGLPLTEDFKLPKFEPIEATDATLDGHRCTKLVFQYQVVRESSDKAIDVHAVVFLSPEEGWILRRYELARGMVSAPQRTHLVGTVEYGKVENGFPTLKKLTKTFFNQREVYDFTRVEYGPASDGDFTITAYKLPDIGKPSDGKAPVSMGPWLLAGGIGFFFAAIGLRLYSQRRKA